MADKRFEEEEVAWSASERDGDLSSEASSAGESVPGISCPVESVDLVDLQGQDKCRQIYLGTLADGPTRHDCATDAQSLSAVSMLSSA